MTKTDLIFKTSYGRIETLRSLVECYLSGGDYDNGQLETLESGHSSTLEALGRLLQALHDKGVLSKEEVCLIISNQKEEDL